MQLLQLQRDLARRLDAAGVASPQHDARALLMHALQLDWSALVLQGSRDLTPQEEQQVERLAVRRLAREPLQHLLGTVEWGGLTLQVSPAALIPRPETEVLLQLALARLAGWPAARVLDVGTGTGALALALRQARPDLQVLGSDVSPEALALARENAQRTGLAVPFVQADLLEGLQGPFQLIVSNPPYLPEADRQTADPEVGHDPALALYSGPDGLGLARRLALQARPALRPGGTLLLELDPRNVQQLAAELDTQGWRVTVHPDLTGRERFLEAGGR
ncbi:peptide chain release factor N(5)-glutamine methyltransferase [Deinococcus sonorensis]|uniref:Release factor glutamine methyltransferase n=2 Tax=Deinococcus sonorensis TaxID=309891 RepID=A0AAU7UEN4_9DEIO